jgi:hypothetical protein
VRARLPVALAVLGAVLLSLGLPAGFFDEGDLFRAVDQLNGFR